MKPPILSTFGDIALAVASSGIAALLLKLGRTFHSRFKAELTPEDGKYLNIKSGTQLAQLVRHMELDEDGEVTLEDSRIAYAQAAPHVRKHTVLAAGAVGGFVTTASWLR